MEPTLYTNDVLLTDCITPRVKGVTTGDIIIARLPSKPQTLICKRVIGLPGDRLVYSKPNDYDGLTHKPRTVNMTQLREEDSSITVKAAKDLTEQLKKKKGMKEVVVPLGHVWIEGDNHDNSGDSRYYGSIPQGLVLSRVIARLWPPGDCRLFLLDSSKPTAKSKVV